MPPLPPGTEPLHEAVLLWLRSPPSPADDVNRAMKTALEQAASQNLNVNEKNRRGMTALQCACACLPLAIRTGTTVSNGVLLVQFLVECPGIDIHAVDEKEGTALHWAAGYSNHDILQILLSAGANVNAVEEKSGRTPLHTTCTGVSPGTARGTPLRLPPWCIPTVVATIAAIQVLCAAGADLNAIDTIHGQTPLHLACASGKLQVAEEMLRLGADRRVADTKGCLALHNTVGTGSNGETVSDMARLLLEYKSTNTDDDEEESGGDKVFHRDMLEWPNHIGDTPLHCALFNHGNYAPPGSMDLEKVNIATAKYFIEVGADVFRENKAGIKPIDCISTILKMDIESHRDYEEEASELRQQVKLLIALVPLMQESVENCNTQSDYADINMSSIGGQMLLKVMAHFNGSGEEDIFELIDPLVAAGADLSCTDPVTGFTMFHSFLTGVHETINFGGDFEDVESYDLDVIQRVLDRHPEDQQKALIGTKTSNGQSLLHFAAEKGYAEIAAWLLEQGLDVNGQDKNGWTPLHWACNDEDLFDAAILEVLVQHGGAVIARTWKDKLGESRLSQTPWEICTRTERLYSDILDFFEHNPFVHRQLKAQCQRALGRSWRPGLNGRLLESMFRTGPAGLAAVYKILPGLIVSRVVSTENEPVRWDTGLRAPSSLV